MAEHETIECRVTPWYFRRMSLITLMLAAFGGWFLYDGLIGYPKKNLEAVASEAFAMARSEDSEKRTWKHFTATSESFQSMEP